MVVTYIGFNKIRSVHKKDRFPEMSPASCAFNLLFVRIYNILQKAFIYFYQCIFFFENCRLNVHVHLFIMITRTQILIT